jgi:hypothetical protein
MLLAAEGQGYLGTVRANERVIRMCKAISDQTRSSTTQLDRTKVGRKLNQMMNGWANYSCLGEARDDSWNIARSRRASATLRLDARDLFPTTLPFIVF